ncbi:SGNH/GDSL hydrolase family protein [Aspergillus candidus]|uniref:SGNH hydrolase n=1 Tax=Aspergillus candidus TaxID=41067 RepID=A0A2I2F846_ASPCN|nr:SGNH hydrolase [Aspergillus candidus]PLB36793.1 SGNH hydrolase [Aspergillus candidus]
MPSVSASLAALLLALLPAAYSTPLVPRLEVKDYYPQIKRLAAIGDSYSAGIGAGKQRSEAGAGDCYRYDESYPSLLNQDGRLGGSDGHDFTYLSCSGDESPQILEQAKKLDGEYDLITISAGGNDLGFSEIVQSCIYRAVFWKDCEKPLKQAEKVLESKEFEKNIKALLKESKKHLSRDGQMYYTGYGKFFNAETTQCNDVDWTLVPEYKPTKLDQKLRERTNKIVNALNEKLNGWVGEAGGKFVNYDKYTEGWLQRFCDEGVTERNPWSDHEDDAWNQMWFQVRFGADDLKKRALELRKKRGTKTSDDLDDYKPEEGKFSDIDQRSLPVELLKVFHPTPVLNTFISNLIVLMVAERQARTENPDISLEKVALEVEEGTCKNDQEEDKVKCNSEDRRAIKNGEFLDHINNLCEEVESRLKRKDDWPYLLHAESYGPLVELNIKKEKSDAKLPDKEKCKTYLKKTLDDCRKGKEWKKGGSIIHDGIKYESAVRVNDHLWCQNASADLSDYVQLELSKYKEAAEDFCGSDISRKAGKEVDKFTSSLPSLSSKINLSINMGDSQGGCLGPKEYKPSKEECVEKFMKIVGNCKEKDGKSYGAGGTFDTPKGCVDYRAEGLSHIIIR